MEANGGVMLSPTILWGILISNCKREVDSSETKEAESCATTALARREERGVAQSCGTAGSLFAGPATLWGILMSVGSVKGITDGSSCTPGNEVLDMAEDSLAGPTTLWGILSSERFIEARSEGSKDFSGCEVLDTNAFTELWITAGYDSQFPMDKNAAVTQEGPMQLHHSPHPPGPYLIKPSPGKGHGVFAARDISKGQHILSDTPFFLVPKPYTQHTVLSSFEQMSLPSRKTFMSLHCPDRSDDIYMTDVMRIFEANCFNIGDRAAIFWTATRFNHSCLPNTYYSWREERGEIVFHAMIDIAEGEEMTICYGRPFGTRIQRSRELRIYGFWCSCRACVAGKAFGEESEERRLAMSALNDRVVTSQSMANETQPSCGVQDPLTNLLQLIELIKEEGLHGELMTPYRDVADCLKIRGKFEEALKFAHMELEEEVLCLGDDSQVVRKTREYIEDLELAVVKGGENAKGERRQENEEIDELAMDVESDMEKRLTEPMADMEELGEIGQHGLVGEESAKCEEDVTTLEKGPFSD